MTQPSVNFNFTALVEKYSKMQSDVIKKIQSLGEGVNSVDPAKFLLIQFQMSQVTQVGDTISNIVYQVNNIISTSIRNQKGG